MLIFIETESFSIKNCDFRIFRRRGAADVTTYTVPELILTYVHADGLHKLVQNNLYQTLAATEISHIKFESYVRPEEAEISFKVPITGLTGVV